MSQLGVARQRRTIAVQISRKFLWPQVTRGGQGRPRLNQVIGRIRFRFSPLRIGIWRSSRGHFPTEDIFFLILRVLHPTRLRTTAALDGQLQLSVLKSRKPSAVFCILEVVQIQQTLRNPDRFRRGIPNMMSASEGGGGHGNADVVWVIA